MSLLTNKIDISTLFYNNWNETPIHWYGLEFDINGIDEWIYVSYNPQSDSNITITNDISQEIGTIEIDIFARKENRTLEIYDMIMNLLRHSRVGSNSVKFVDISSKDVISTVNGDYKILRMLVMLKTL